MSRYNTYLNIALIIAGISIPAAFSQAYWVNGICYPDQYDNCYNTQINIGGVQGVQASNPEAHVCSSLAVLGLGCDAPTQTNKYQRQTNSENFFNFWNFNTQSSNTNNTSNTNPSNTEYSYSNPNTGIRGFNFGNIIANILGTGSGTSRNSDLVKVKNSPDIYMLENGKKHKVPNIAVFNDYGFSMNQVREISQAELNQYPRVSLVKNSGRTYYLTESGMVRRIYKDSVLESYGRSKAEIVSISDLEFAQYPKNEFVYLQSQPEKDVFQLINKERRYVTPVALANLGVKENQIAPVNEVELKSYKLIKPLIQ